MQKIWIFRVVVVRYSAATYLPALAYSLMPPLLRHVSTETYPASANEEKVGE